MKFEYEAFSCDVDILRNEQKAIVRFYDRTKEQNENEIVNLVIVDAGYGFLTITFKGDCALVGGFLDADIFTSNEMADAAAEFAINCFPENANRYILYHIDRVKKTDYIEYNGEY